MRPSEAIDRIQMISNHGREMQEQRDLMIDAVKNNGEFSFFGRRVLLTFEDSGCRTHEDPQLQKFYKR